MRSSDRVAVFSCLLFRIFIASLGTALDLRECSRPLGMESGRIKDEQITASSSHDAESTGPQNSRIRTEQGSGAWCPKRQINAETSEWLQIDFADDVAITGLETQGRYDGGRGMEYAPAYMIEYRRLGMDTWARYRDAKHNEVISANSDTQSTVLRLLHGAIIARHVRIIPVSEVTRTVCMRLELYGCNFDGHVISYSIPDGDAVDGLSLKDASYDGHINGSGILVDGLGSLFDGITGEDNFEKYPNEWMGWRKDLHGSPVTLELFFDSKKTVSAVLFHVSNFIKYRAQVFERAHMWFSSQGNGIYSPRTIHFSYAIDKNFQSSRWVRIPVPNRVAKQIRVELSVAADAEWLLLSEINLEFARNYQHDNQLEEKFEEEIEFDHSSNEEKITYFTVDSSIEENNRWISIVSAIFFLLLSLICALSLLLYLLWICRRTAIVRPHKMSPNAKDVQLLVEQTTVKRPSQNTYRLTSNSVQDSLFEKLHQEIDVGSEYVDPDSMRIGSDHGTNSTVLCGSSRSPSKSPTIHYASRDISLITNNYGDRSTFKGKKSERSYQMLFDDIPERVNNINIIPIDPESFRYLDWLGCCKYGEVNLCQLEHRLVVVQNLMKSADKHLMDEYKKVVLEMSSFRHQNILELIGVGNEDQPIGCTIEFIPETLDSFMTKQHHCGADLYLSICTQIAAGMSYLESRNHVHRNLKPSSCFITPDGTIKIGRFWIASGLDNYNCIECSGDGIKRSAVESFLSKVYSTKSDVWTFGIVLWEVLSSCRLEPYKDLSNEEVEANLFHVYEHGTFQVMLEKPEHCTATFYQNFMVDCWRRDPKQRPSFKTLHRKLQNMSCDQMSTARSHRKLLEY